MTTLLLMFLFVFGPSRKPVLTDHSKNCPVKIYGLEPWLGPRIGLSPLVPSLTIDYENVSDKRFLEMKVGPITAYDAFNAPNPKPDYANVSTDLKPGKKSWVNVYESWWQDDNGGAAGGTDVIISAVAFQDGSTWTADADHVCKASLRYVTK